MSLERMHSEQVCRCENCGMRSLSSAIIAGKHFCSVLCYERWKVRREQERRNET